MSTRPDVFDEIGRLAAGHDQHGAALKRLELETLLLTVCLLGLAVILIADRFGWELPADG